MSPAAARFTASGRFVPLFAQALQCLGWVAPFPSQLVGVGHDPDSWAAVSCTNVGSSNDVPFTHIPERGNRPHDSGERAAVIIVKKVDGVFRHKESWAESRNNSETLAPHPSLIGRSFPLACLADWLARHAGAN